jgi:hypothetical protein
VLCCFLYFESDEGEARCFCDDVGGDIDTLRMIRGGCDGGVTSAYFTTCTLPHQLKLTRTHPVFVSDMKRTREGSSQASVDTGSSKKIKTSGIVLEKTETLEKRKKRRGGRKRKRKKKDEKEKFNEDRSTTGEKRTKSKKGRGHSLHSPRFQHRSGQAKLHTCLCSS